MSNHQGPDDYAISLQIGTVMAVIESEWKGHPKSRPPIVPDETLDFATGRVKPRSNI